MVNMLHVETGRWKWKEEVMARCWLEYVPKIIEVKTNPWVDPEDTARHEECYRGGKWEPVIW
jgi:hypothetical protein